MGTYTVLLGGAPVTIVAPERGHFDAMQFEAALEGCQEYGLDVETRGFDPVRLYHYGPRFSVCLIQLATDREAWVLDLRDGAQRAAAIGVLSDPSRRAVSHTDMDVLSIRRELGIDISDRNIDTQVLAAIAFPDRAGRGDLDLKTLSAELIGPELVTAERVLHERFDSMWAGRHGTNASKVQHGWDTIPVTDPIYRIYAGLDALVAKRLKHELTALTDTPDAVVDLDCWLAGRLAARRHRGLRVDREAAERLLADSEAVAAHPKERIRALTGLRSTQTQQLSAWMTEHGVEGRRTNGGQLSLSKDSLPSLIGTTSEPTAREALDCLLKVREQADVITKTKSLLARLDAQSRVRPRIAAVGAPTARMSCSGFNMQAVSKRDHRQRGLFLPEPSHTFIGADFDQIELRLVAALAGEEAMYETVRAGGDLHQLTADRIGVERSVAKAVNFMIVYGGGGMAVAEKTGLPITECQKHVEAFREVYPAITALAQGCRQLSSITTITGRRLLPPMGKRSPRTYANINYLIQSSARDVLVMAWRRFANSYQDMVWLSIHDELILEVPDVEVAQASLAVESAMNFSWRGMPFAATAVPLIDEHGQSRWMSTDRAEELARRRTRSEPVASPSPAIDPESDLKRRTVSRGPLAADLNPADEGVHA